MLANDTKYENGMANRYRCNFKSYINTTTILDVPKKAVAYKYGCLKCQL